MKLFGGFVRGADNNTVIALADYPGVDIKGGLSPIKLERTQTSTYSTLVVKKNRDPRLYLQ
jgi:hypothetical protein